MTEWDQEVIDQIHEEWVGKNLDVAGRERANQAVWNSFLAIRKKPVADLEARTEEFRKRIEALSKDFTIAIEGGRFVVRATGEADATLTLLQRGTGWFDPIGDVTVLIIGAVFE